MKRVIFGILVLLAAWQLLQVPSVNAAFFAFLTLGINPLTNHPLSTLSLIFLLISLSAIAILIFFNRALGDFLGGISDWLTRVERDYTIAEDSNSPSTHATLLLSVQATVDEATASHASPFLTGFSVVIRKLRVSLKLAQARAYFSRRTQRYARSLARLYTRIYQHTINERQTTPKEKEYESALPATIRRGLEQTFRETKAMEWPEAVIVEKGRLTTLISTLSRQLAAARALMVNYTEKSIKQIARVSGTTKRQIARTVYGAARSVGNFAVTVYRAVYRGSLLMALGILLGFGRMAQITQQVVWQVRKVAIAGAITITLSMLALGRSVLASVRSISRVLLMAGRSTYWLVSNIVMLVFLAAGYLLFVFTLLCFMVWEICEPYARRFDHWLGTTFGESHELAEAAKIGHEISRTFAQWYRELRNLKHSIYR